MRTGTNRKTTPAQPTGATLEAEGTTLTAEWGTNADGSTLNLVLVDQVSGAVQSGSALDSAETFQFPAPGVTGHTYVARLTAYRAGEASKVTTTDPETVE